MTKYRHHLPQLDGGLFLTDGGMETTLIFREKIDLPCFAAFDLLKDQRGADILLGYYARHAAIARDSGAGFILDSATRRANPDWAEKLGYSPRELDVANARAINMLFDLRAAHETATSPMVISGCIGPRGDGYDPGVLMSPREAMVYHSRQIGIFATAGVDLVTAYTLNNTNEAIGVTRAAREAGLPVAISFTLETDGRLPTGEALRDAIRFVDHATDSGPAYYMIDCAHPTHFEQALDDDDWMARLRGIRANASRRSHAELDEAADLDDGDPVELGRQYRDLRARFPHINVLGGCCGTDHRHIEQICRNCGQADIVARNRFINESGG
jgi:S-methylmethionine-dependent homocysteine/selenocysteine methylase